MESKDKKVELLQIAIKQLIQEENHEVQKSAASSSPSSSDADRRLLSKLLSQLETLKDDEMPEEEPNIQKVECPEEPQDFEKNESEMEKEDIVKELKRLRRQNFITHALLSAMILLTVTWQLSEFSLIMKVKEVLSNPVKTLGGMLKGIIKRPRLTDQDEDEDKQGPSPAQPNPLLRAYSLPGLKIPDLPHLELPAFDLVHDDEQ